MPRDVPGYDSGMKGSEEEEGDEPEEKEDIEAGEEEGKKTDERPPLGN